MNPIVNLTLQRRTPESMRGRAMGVVIALAYGAYPIGVRARRCPRRALRRRRPTLGGAARCDLDASSRLLASCQHPSLEALDEQPLAEERSAELGRRSEPSSRCTPLRVVPRVLGRRALGHLLLGSLGPRGDRHRHARRAACTARRCWRPPRGRRRSASASIGSSEESPGSRRGRGTAPAARACRWPSGDARPPSTLVARCGARLSGYRRSCVSSASLALGGQGRPPLEPRREYDGGVGARDPGDLAQPPERLLQRVDVADPHLEDERLVAGDEPAVLDLLELAAGARRSRPGPRRRTARCPTMATTPRPRAAGASAAW